MGCKDNTIEEKLIVQGSKKVVTCWRNVKMFFEKNTSFMVGPQEANSGATNDLGVNIVD